MPEPDHGQCGKEDDDPAQRNLSERQISRFDAQTEQCFKGVPEYIHRKRFYRLKTICRASLTMRINASHDGASKAVSDSRNELIMMSTPPETAKSPGEEGRLHPDRIESEILANERTFLAWVRTSIAVMSLGFIISRFSLWMREMAMHINPQMPMHRSGLSAPLGECMIGAGALITVFAAWRYRVINRSIRRGEVQADPQMVTAITVIVL